MNQSEYLNQLRKYLKKLPKPDYENAMEYFTEYFEEVGEQRAMGERQKRQHQIFWIIF